MKIRETFLKDVRSIEDARQIMSHIAKILDKPENEFIVHNFWTIQKEIHASHLKYGLYVTISKISNPVDTKKNIVIVELQYLEKDKNMWPTEFINILNLMEKQTQQ